MLLIDRSSISASNVSLLSSLDKTSRQARSNLTWNSQQSIPLNYVFSFTGICFCDGSVHGYQQPERQFWECHWRCSGFSTVKRLCLQFYCIGPHHHRPCICWGVFSCCHIPCYTLSSSIPVYTGCVCSERNREYNWYRGMEGSIWNF